MGHPVLIFNPHAGQKVGLSTTSTGPDQAFAALKQAGIAFDAQPTQRPGHATELAKRAVLEGRPMVIAAGGDGTLEEVAQALVGTTTVLGVMPLGSIMNVARTLSIPREVDGAASVIAAGMVLAMDVGRHDGRYFLEAAGVGLDAGLYGYFNRLEDGAAAGGVLKAALHFVRGIGTPLLAVTADGKRLQLRAPLVTIANAPFCGAAYTMAQDARIDDGLLDVVVFRVWVSCTC
jgi:diacylglycerol kinase family enzyme